MACTIRDGEAQKSGEGLSTAAAALEHLPEAGLKHLSSLQTAVVAQKPWFT
jgi:hypothetical protein